MPVSQDPPGRRARTLQVALNGGVVTPGMPLTPEDIASDAAACVAAGATLLHLHAYRDDGTESLDEGPVARTIHAVRSACPGVPISMTTFAQVEPDPHRRLSTIARWSVLPDLVPANQGEQGIEELADLLLARGVEVEACVFSVGDVELMLRRGGLERFRRIVVEPMEADPAAACEHARAMEAALAGAGVQLEQVQHGMGPASWPVLRQSLARGHGTRTGLEDIDVLPDGTRTTSNVSLVRAAVELAELATGPHGE